MSFFSAMDTLASGLGAERVRMNVTASNLANAQTTRTEDGGPYRRKDPVFRAVLEEADSSDPKVQTHSVEVADIVDDPQAPRRVYDPGHPDAGPDGYVDMPNIAVVEEMVNMMTAARSYEAGVTALDAMVQMAERALQIGK